METGAAGVENVGLGVVADVPDVGWPESCLFGDASEQGAVGLGSTEMAGGEDLMGTVVAGVGEQGFEKRLGKIGVGEEGYGNVGGLEIFVDGKDGRVGGADVALGGQLFCVHERGGGG